MFKHIFQISYFNALEKNIPDEIDLERMIASKNFKEALTVLQDTSYASFASQDTPLSLEEIIEKEEAAFAKDLVRIGLAKEAREFLLFKHDLFNLSLELKKELFGLGYSKKDLNLKSKYAFLAERIKQARLQEPREIDEKINEFYFDEAIKKLEKLKEKQLKIFFTEYQKALLKENKEGLKKKLLELESEFLEKNKWQEHGLAPIFCFFLKRKTAQKKIQIVLSAKQIGLKPNVINQLTAALPALL